MGNICSSGKSRNKDDISQKSRESISYQATEKLESKKTDNFCVDDANIIEHNEKYTLCSKNETEDKNSCGSPLSTHTINSATELLGLLPPSKKLTIVRGDYTAQKCGKIKKIVFVTIAINSIGRESANQIISKIHDNFQLKCKLQGFEFVTSDIHYFNCSDSAKCLHNCQMEERELISSSLSEIHRHLHSSYIIPVIFIGSRLESLMIPKTIASNHFRSILILASRKEKQLLEKWYKLNDNSTSLTFYSLQMDCCFKNDIKICYEANCLLVTLLRLFTDDLKDLYIKTLLEEELNNAILTFPELTNRCICIETETQFKLVGEFSVLLQESNRRLANILKNLKEHILERNMLKFWPTRDLLNEEMITTVECLLEKSVDMIFEEYFSKYDMSGNTLGIETNLFIELESLGFYTRALAKSVKNFGLLPNIKRYFNGADSCPLVIKCNEGGEKRILVSKIVDNIHKWEPKSHLILRYAKFSVVSMNLSAVLRSVAHHMSILVNGEACSCCHSIESYSKVIKDLMTISSLLIVIVIDSVDELFGIDNFDWLPIISNCSTKIVLTVTETNHKENNWTLRQLEKLIPSKNFLTLEHCSDVYQDRSSHHHQTTQHKSLNLEENWKYFHEIAPDHSNQLRNSIRLSDNSSNELVRKYTLNDIIACLESELDSAYIELLLILIGTSLWGIHESDCTAILEEQFKLEKDVTRHIWAKFCWIMGPMMIHSINIRIEDVNLRRMILERYKEKVIEVYTILKHYFEDQPDFIVDPATKTEIYNYTKFANLPYYVLMEFKEDVSNRSSFDNFFHTKYFSDINWIFKKLIATCSMHLLNDIELAENILSVEASSITHISLLREFLELYMCEINYDGRQFPTLLKLFLKNNLKKFNPNENECIKIWNDYIASYRMPHFEIINNTLVPQNNQLNENYNGYDIFINLPVSGCFIASISTKRQEICLWDVPNCKRVRVLKGIPEPTAMCAIGLFDAAVLCKREIKIINLDEGKFKNTLKGVMNQNMPYFGLHDEKHLVCLSRNRMYVNLMDLETGDCVTTFKAGEDRFLNSLLVSGDGRILVCGDETQKPFPLLVWHLAQRKLLYDFRIPYHEFLTSLSAITHEGSYVCVAAKELNELTPNFIVVYDLQSGTLFKKWKPSCNTISLTISQENTCVVAGLEDAKVVIWDLVTGNSRSILQGHNAPATLLKIDPSGKVLLSGNKEGKDKSIRLWELNSGNLLAVYTPPNQITACEILPNGTFIALALRNCSEIIALALKNYNEESNTNNILIYGNPENNHQTFILSNTNQ